MRKIISFTYIFLIVAAILLSRPSALVDTRQAKGLGVMMVGEIADGASVSQVFAPRHDNITGVGVLAQNFERPDFGDLVLTVWEVKNASAGRLIRGRRLARVVKPATGTTNNAVLRFWFSPVPVKVGKLYAFNLTSSSLPGQGITVWSAKANVYVPGRAYFERPLAVSGSADRGISVRAAGRSKTEISDPGDLFFMTYYHRPFLATIRELFDDSGRRPLAPAFVVVFAALAAACFAGLALAHSTDLLTSKEETQV